jgi:hypothetical protein
MIFWIILGIFVLLYLLPLGIRFVYSSEGCRIWLLAGPVPIKVYPKNKRAKKPEKGAIKADKQGKKSTPKKPAEGKEEKKEGGSLSDFLPFVDIARKFLYGIFRKHRIRRLEIKMLLAGDDPCDLAVNYGKAWAATGNLIPLLEEHFIIKKRDVQIGCDFTAEETVIYVRADITILLGRLITLAAVHGFHGFREYLKLMKKRKGE